jgi:hypothetical protein
VTFPVSQMDQRFFNSTFPSHDDHGTLGPFQNNVIKYCFFTLGPGLALNALGALRESATFSAFNSTVCVRRADHQLNFFIVKT